MKDWVFQWDGKRFDPDTELVNGRETWWRVTGRKQREQIEVGDRVWVSRIGRRDPGICYVATVVGPVYENPNQDPRWRTELRFDYRLDPPLLRSRLAPDPVLRDCPALYGFHGTNEPIDTEQGNRLLQLSQSHLVQIVGRNNSNVASYDIHDLAEELNEGALNHPIGGLQKLRAELHHRRSIGQKIFRPATTTDEWAFHYGGRKELQFNIGVYNDDLGRPFEVRHGVAFSFETSRTLPNVDPLVAKVRLFNDFIHLNREHYADMRMWHEVAGSRERGAEYMPGPIPKDLVTDGTFVFLGKRQVVDGVDCETILGDFDRLLPLYRYVEGEGAMEPLLLPQGGKFLFKPGGSVKTFSATASYAERLLDIDLRHKAIQAKLQQLLISEHGAENVRVEQPGVVGFLDIVVKRPEGFWFYEIKTAPSARTCIREALGQLLEYSFWPGAEEPSRLIVVGERAIDADGKRYVECLRERFGLPLEYQQVAL